MAATKVSLSLQVSKPALPPKPNFLLTDTTSKLTRFTHILNTTKLVSDMLNTDMTPAESQVNMACEKSSQCKQSLFIDGVELNETGDAASLAFNLLDEIYAEIEDKQIKSSLSKQMTLKMLNTPELLNYLNKKQQQQQQQQQLQQEEAKAAEVAADAVSPDKHKTDECCNSLSCSSSSYTSASSSQSNHCSCTYSSSSVSSTYSTNESDQLQQPPPLPTVPPPPLQSAQSSPNLPRSTRHNNNRISLTLEEEIELEMKTKLNSFSLNKEAPDEHQKEADFDEKQPEEDEYLEPVLLETEKSYSTDTLNAGDSKESQLNHYAVPYSMEESPTFTAVTSTPTKTLSSPYRLKSLFRLNSSSRPVENASERIVPNAATNTSVTSNDDVQQKTPKKALNYLFKTSGRITSTLRMMRTKSSSHASNNELNLCGDEVDSIEVIDSPNHFIDNMFTLRKNKKAKKTAVSCQPPAAHAVEISGPTLISQTFDLSKQRLVAIQNQQEFHLSCEQAASFSSMSSSTFSSSSFDEHSNHNNNSCSPALPRANKFSLAQSRAASTLSINNISPTIALNTIITNVYEEDGNISECCIVIRFPLPSSTRHQLLNFENPEKFNLNYF